MSENLLEKGNVTFLSVRFLFQEKVMTTFIGDFSYFNVSNRIELLMLQVGSNSLILPKI